MTAIKKRTKILVALTAVALILLAALIAWLIWGNMAIETTHQSLSYDTLPEEFDGFRIALVSDLHNTEFGESNEHLIEAIREAEPDIIAITGDLVDSRRTNVEIALKFASEAAKLAPCYYVTGNHESRIPEEFAALRAGLTELGVTVLDDESVKLTRGDSHIMLIGSNDPSFGTNMYNALDNVENEDFSILLIHRPDFFKGCSAHGVDLMLCGHVHGAQVRLPFIGGVYAPSYGLFPEYDAGAYTEGDSQMYISRGLGNSAFPLRINNRPELAIIELERN